MDIVYTFKYDNRSFNTQLKYSLRSVEKFLKGFRNVYVIGFNCNLKNIIHIEHSDIFSPGKNIITKLLFMADLKELSEDFFYMADDHFILKDIGINNYPYYSNGTLTELLKTQRNTYSQNIKNTLQLFPDGRNFNIHCPIIYNKEKLKELRGKYDLSHPLNYLTKSLYGNHFNLYEGKEIKDCKIRTNFQVDEILNRISGRDCWSTGKEWECPNIISALNLLYPQKSIFEK